MAQNEPLLTRLASHRRRRLFVIILTCGVGLLAVWPAADEYFALREKRADLIQSVAEARGQVSRLDQLEGLAEERAEALAALETKAVREHDVNEFRGEIVKLIRRNGCQLRRIELAPASRRAWRENDHPFQMQSALKKSATTPYQLRSQRLTLTISGPFGRVQSFLQQLHDMNKWMHTERFSLRPTGDQRDEVVLELELVLIDLEKTEPPVSA